MLLYKLLLYNTDGKLYNSIKSIYVSTSACFRVNQKITNWFSCKSRVKQGDSYSPSLFSILIDDLVQEINSFQLGVNTGDTKVSIFLYSADTVLLACNEEDMQCLLDKLYDWYKRWRVLINTDKTKVMHFRKGRRKQSVYQFKIGNNSLEFTNSYKYLGVIFTD